MHEERINILGVEFDNVTMEEAVKKGLSFFDGKGPHVIFTPNPEIVMAAYENNNLRKILNDADMVIPDGIGIIIGSRVIHKPLKERVAGYDFTQLLFGAVQKKNKRICFYGAKPGVAELAAKKMRLKYPDIDIVEIINGYEKNQEEVLGRIVKARPDLLLVGLGAPRQEEWIFKYKAQIDVDLIIGVGGSFDAMAEVVKRAPSFFIRLNLEWFYRLLTQPTRFRRMLKLPLFLFKMMTEGKEYS